MESFSDSVRELVLMGARRLGTAGAVWFASQGVPADMAGQLELAAVVVAGVAFDYVMVRLRKRNK